VIRPGPRSLAAGVNPGGVVVHVYSVPTGKLLRVQQLQPDMTGAALAAMAADAASFSRQVCLVAYDGDTGGRIDLSSLR
jgi:hypothetical protein